MLTYLPFKMAKKIVGTFRCNSHNEVSDKLFEYIVCGPLVRVSNEGRVKCMLKY